MPQVTHEIQSGETLQQIAAEKLHNVGLWTDLVQINHLHFPYIVKTEKEKSRDPLHLVTYGDIIQLAPNKGFANSHKIYSLQDANNQHVYDSVLGMDLQLGFGQSDDNAPGNNYGDQVAYLKMNKDNSDLGRVWGIQNLLQSLTVRLVTEKGTLPYHPQFGSRLNQFIGTPEHTKSGNAGSTAQDIKNEIERVCYTDQRVQNAKVVLCRLYNENFFAIVAIKPLDPYSTFKIYVDSFNGDHIEVSWDRDD